MNRVGAHVTSARVTRAAQNRAEPPGEFPWSHVTRRVTRNRRQRRPDYTRRRRRPHYHYNVAVLRALAAGAGLILAGFHLWLFGQQAWTGRLESTVSLRWLLAFGLVAGLVALHRRGSSLWGRRATALWVLATVLHGPALADRQALSPQVLAETSEAALQIAGAAIGLALALGLGHVARTAQTARAPRGTAWPRVAAGPRFAAFGDGFLPRPPPAA